jgi:hypothetical protein
MRPSARQPKQLLGMQGLWRQTFAFASDLA